MAADEEQTVGEKIEQRLAAIEAHLGINQPAEQEASEAATPAEPAAAPAPAEGEPAPAETTTPAPEPPAGQ